MSSGISDSLQYKTLKVDFCNGKLCSSTLSLKPFSLYGVFFTFTCDSMQEVHTVIETIAYNDRLQVKNLALIYASGPRVPSFLCLNCSNSSQHFQLIGGRKL